MSQTQTQTEMKLSMYQTLIQLVDRPTQLNLFAFGHHLLLCQQTKDIARQSVKSTQSPVSFSCFMSLEKVSIRGEVKKAGWGKNHQSVCIRLKGYFQSIGKVETGWLGM